MQQKEASVLLTSEKMGKIITEYKTQLRELETLNIDDMMKKLSEGLLKKPDTEVQSKGKKFLGFAQMISIAKEKTAWKWFFETYNKVIEDLKKDISDKKVDGKGYDIVAILEKIKTCLKKAEQFRKENNLDDLWNTHTKNVLNAIDNVRTCYTAMQQQVNQAVAQTDTSVLNAKEKTQFDRAVKLLEKNTDSAFKCCNNAQKDYQEKQKRVRQNIKSSAFFGANVMTVSTMKHILGLANSSATKGGGILGSVRHVYTALTNYINNPQSEQSDGHKLRSYWRAMLGKSKIDTNSKKGLKESLIKLKQFRDNMNKTMRRTATSSILQINAKKLQTWSQQLTEFREKHIANVRNLQSPNSFDKNVASSLIKNENETYNYIARELIELKDNIRTPDAMFPYIKLLRLDLSLIPYTMPNGAHDVSKFDTITSPKTGYANWRVDAGTGAGVGGPFMAVGGIFILEDLMLMQLMIALGEVTAGLSIVSGIGGALIAVGLVPTIIGICYACQRKKGEKLSKQLVANAQNAKNTAQVTEATDATAEKAPGKHGNENLKLNRRHSALF